MQFNEENSGKKSQEETDQFNFYPEWQHLEDYPWPSALDSFSFGMEYEPGSYMKNFQKGNDEERRKQYLKILPHVRKAQKKYASYMQRGKEIEAERKGKK